MRDNQWPLHLQAAVRIAEQLHSELELALFLGDSEADNTLDALGTFLQSAPIARVIIFREAEASVGTTSPDLMIQVRQVLGNILPGVPLVGGTNGNFAELNRQQPNVSVMDGVAYTINPQVHASDERSLIEAISAQRDTVSTTRSFCGDVPVIISSVTLKPPSTRLPPKKRPLPQLMNSRQR
ncbi:MAG: hypothetical protein R3C44_03660 [Chloroflexota bacterium]